MNQSRSLSLSIAKKRNLSKHPLRNILALLALVVLWTGCDTGGESEIIRDNPDVPTKYQGGGSNTGIHEYVDLGLPSGLKWATMNVGANSPEEYGDYFAWGETTMKSYYEWYTNKWYDDYSDCLTKYCTDNIYGRVDNKATLDLSDDAAHVNWGGSWRMPTCTELMELMNKCKWTWTTMNKVNGYKVVGPNGKSLFLPAAGYFTTDYVDEAGKDGYYWSSSLDTTDPWDGFCLIMDLMEITDQEREYGFSIRAVCP